MTSEVIYQGQLRTKATHIKSGSTIITDAPIDNQGNGEAFSPTDLVATSVASCILTIMGIKARDKDIDITGAKANVKKVMASNPRRIAKVQVVITMPHQSYTEKQKKLLEKAAHHCPVARSLSDDLDEQIEIIWP